MSGSDYRPVPIEDVMARFSPERVCCTDRAVGVQGWLA